MVMTKEEKIKFWQKVKAKFIKIHDNGDGEHLGLCWVIEFHVDNVGYYYKEIFNLDNARKHANATGLDEDYFWWDMDRNWNDPYDNHHSGDYPGIKEIKGVYDYENRLLFLDWIINNVE